MHQPAKVVVNLVLLSALAVASTACNPQPAVSPTPTIQFTATPPATPTPTGGGTGRIAFSSYRAGESEIYIMNADGSEVTCLTDSAERSNQPTWSPDGRRIAFVRREDGDNLEIFAMNAAGSGQVRLTALPFSLDSEPAWSPDGSQIAFTSSQGSYMDMQVGRVTIYNIYVINADGSGLTCLTGNNAGGDTPSSVAELNEAWNTSPSWSPDGQQIIFRSNRDGNDEIYVMAADGSEQRNLTHHPASDADPAWSPDGTRIAFVSDRDGDGEIYVMDADGSNPTRLTDSPRKDTHPAWSPDGQWIAFYSNREGDLGLNFEIYVMRADGSGQTRLTYHGDFDGFPAWQPPISLTSTVPIPATSVTGTTAAGYGLQVEPGVAAWLQDNAIPIATVEAGSGCDDLVRLGEIIGEARIVALGAATCGTHEFFTMKHRLLEYLVEELGFNTLAIEANWGDTDLINHYIHTGEGDAAQLLADLGERWNTQEMLDVIEWMRAHNQEPGDAPQVSFYGFDLGNPLPSMDHVVAYLQQVDADEAARADSLYDCFREYQDNWVMYSPFVNPRSRDCADNVQQVSSALFSQSDEYIAASSQDEYAFALQSARIVVQAETFYRTLYSEIRNHGMARNVTWLLEQAGPDNKLILWTHNFHVADTCYEVDFPSYYPSDSYPSMGSHLDETYGKDLFRIGFAFSAGQVNALNYDTEDASLTTFQVPPAPPGSFGWFARSAGLPAFILPIELVDIVGHPGADWLVQPLLLRSIYFSYDEAVPGRYFFEYHPDDFDAMIYIEQSTPTQLLSAVSSQ